MRKILFLLVALTIVLSASADVDLKRDQLQATRQEAPQTFIERVQQHAKAQKAQPQHQPQRERLTQHESKAKAQPKFKVPHKKTEGKSKASTPTTLKGFSKSELDAQKEILKTEPYKATVVTKAPNRTPVVIENQPEGELVEYDHALSVYSFSYQEVRSGTIKSNIVYAPDGVTVYIQKIFGGDSSSGWVSGTISGNKITIPMGQYTYYSSYYGWWKKLVWGTTTRNESDKIVFVEDPNVTEVTFTIGDDGVITLDNSSAGNNGEGAAGLAIVDEEDIALGLEWGSEYTPVIPVVIPEIIYDQPEGELVTYMYSCNYYDFYDNEVYFDSTIAKIVYAPDGETVYIQMYNEAPWLTATIVDDKIHMPLGQYIYYDEDEGYGDIYAWGTIVPDPDGDGVQFVQDNTVTEVTYTIQGNVITMDNSDGGNDGIGAVGLAEVSDDGTNSYYLEWNSTFTRWEVPTVITDQPQGELKTYRRSGYQQYPDYEIMEQSSMGDGKVKIVYANDNKTVYIKDPVSGIEEGTWVKGTLKNGKISVPMGQYVYWDDQYYYGLKLAWGTLENGVQTYDSSVTEATYTIDGNFITLDNSYGDDQGTAAAGLCVLWDDNDEVSSMEWNTVFTGKPVIITYPTGEMVTLRRNGYIIDEQGQVIPQEGPVNIVYDYYDENTVYIQDIFYGSNLGSWVKGTIEGGKIHVPLKQFVYWNDEYFYGVMLGWGQLAYNNDNGYYYLNYDPSVTEVTFTINGENFILDNTSFGPGNEALGASVFAAVYSVIPSEYQQCELMTQFNAPPTVSYEDPEGEVVYYDHMLQGIDYETQNVITGNYSPQIVYAPDGRTVYILDPVGIGFVNYGTRVTGTIDGNKIRVPLGQYLIYYEEEYAGLVLTWGTNQRDENNNFVFVQDPSVTEVTYTISGNSLILDNTSAGDENGVGAIGLAAMWDNNSSSYSMIWESVLVPAEVPTVIDNMPEGELVIYNRTGRAMERSGNVVNQNTKLKMVYAPDGETVYIQNIGYGPHYDTWVTGTISGNKITVPLGQYIQYLYSYVPRYGCKIAAGTAVKVNGVLTYTPATDNITELIYTIHDDGTITLDNTNGGPNDDGVGGVGLCSVLENNNQCYGMEWNTVLTRSTEPVIITDQPQGIHKKYFRTTRPVINNTYPYNFDYSTVEIVYSETSNAVYIKDPVSGPACAFGTWVKGTINGNIITIPTGQYLTYNTTNNYYDKLYWLREEPHYEWIDGQRVQVGTECHTDYSMTNVTYTIHGENITMNDYYPSEYKLGIAAISYDIVGDGEYIGGWDLTAEFIPYFEPIVLDKRPEGALVSYNRRGSGIFHAEEFSKSNVESQAFRLNKTLLPQSGKTYVVYAPDGRTVYLYEPVMCRTNVHAPRLTWVMGTLSEDGHKIIVPLDQYVFWDPEHNFAERLAWGTSHVELDDWGDGDIYFVPDNSVMTVTYTIQDDCISMDNSSGTRASMYHEPDWPSWARNNTGLATVDQFGNWCGEMNWCTTLGGNHPAVPMDPEIGEWYDSGSENGNSTLQTFIEDIDVDGYGINMSGLSYSIYTDKGKLFTFEASKYGLDEDATEITYDMWRSTWRLKPSSIYFYRTNAEGYEPFFEWRIGIQLHYTYKGVKQSSNIVYLEVFDKPDDPVTLGDADGDGVVAVQDVTKMIDSMLNGDLSNINLENADVNGDGRVTVADITALIDMLLSGI